MIYRITTEDKNEPLTKVSNWLWRFGFESATIYSAMGLWHGKFEASLVIEIDAPNDVHTLSSIRSLASHIRIDNKQEAVLVQLIDARSDLATASQHAFENDKGSPEEGFQFWAQDGRHSAIQKAAINGMSNAIASIDESKVPPDVP